MPRWVVVQYDLEMEEWAKRTYNSRLDARQGLIDWVEEELENMEVEYELTKDNDNQFIMILDEYGKQFGVIRPLNATLDPGYRKNFEWSLFYIE